MLTPGQVLQGRYHIDALLGAGGMGEVYKATDVHRGALVAVKESHVLSPDPALQAKFREQFELEAKMLSSLSHPNLVRLVHYFFEGDVQYIVMEYFEGTTLAALAHAGYYRDEPSALRVTNVLLDVLEYLHSQSPAVILRDLKPDNIMVARDGRIAIIDFGIAKWHVPGQGTHSAANARTEGFSPLEQYGGSTDARSDLYSLGATLLYMLTGLVPPAAVARVTNHVPLPDPRGVNPTVSERTWKAVQALMALSPADRPANVAAARCLFSELPFTHLAPAPTMAASAPGGVAPNDAEVEYVYWKRRLLLALVTLPVLLGGALTLSLLIARAFDPTVLPGLNGSRPTPYPPWAVGLTIAVGLSWLAAVIVASQLSSVVAPQRSDLASALLALFPPIFCIPGCEVDRWLSERGIGVGALGPHGLEAWKAKRAGRTSSEGFDPLYPSVSLLVVVNVIGLCAFLSLSNAPVAGVGAKEYACGPDERVYYARWAKERDAVRFSKWLATHGIFGTGHGGAFRLSREANGYVLIAVATGNAAWTSDQYFSEWELFRRELSEEVFDGAGIRFQMCDGRFWVYRYWP